VVRASGECNFGSAPRGSAARFGCRLCGTALSRVVLGESIFGS
jgi:hypothetical protein